MQGIRQRLVSAALLIVVGCAGPAVAPSDPPEVSAPSPTSASATPTVPTAGSPPAPTPSAPDASPASVVAPSASVVAPSASASPRRTPTELRWTELSPPLGPSPREDHTWTVGDDGRTAYLFGGRSGHREFDELWAYDLASDEWTVIEPTGERPTARFGHTAVWVDGLGLVIWSGQAGPTFFADTWAFEPSQNSWRELAALGDVPPARYGSCAALGPDGRMWISHGFTDDTGRFADTRAYQFQTGTWTDMTPAGQLPVERCLHDCLWTADGRLMLYAGQTTGAPAIGDMWTYDPSAEEWSQAEPPPVEPRQLYALASVGETAFVFGGGAADGGVLGDLWQLDLGSLGWSSLAPRGGTPTARSGASLISDTDRDRLLLFGGVGEEGELSDLWQLELAASR